MMKNNRIRHREINSSERMSFSLILVPIRSGLRGTVPPHPDGEARRPSETVRMHPFAKSMVDFRKIGMLILMLCVLLCSALSAQAEPPDDMDRPMTRMQMEKVRDRVETLRMWKLTKALDLDDKTSAVLFPLLNRMDKKRAELERGLATEMRELRASLRERRDGQLKGILERLEQNHRALQGLNDEERSELKKILNLEQQAKYVLFQQEFSREIRKIIEEARERRAERFGGPDRPDRPERPFAPGR
ncbi:MAG: hypothetical protein HZA17_07210 [Nitrospirae bacterium]|nr:hypothetical protein [Nitrospirota bacterium]